jgi:hypothetical protein
MGASDAWVIKLSTGALLYHRQYTNVETPFIRASHDGQYLAEQTASPNATGFGATVIRRTSDGREVARLDNQTVVAFSWDGSRVVTMPAMGTSAPNEARLVDWQSGTVLWRLTVPPPSGTPDRAAVYALPRPNGTDLMIGVGPQSAAGIDSLWLVHADGTARQVAKGPLWPGF